jgi:hypothetical protein
VPPQPRDARGQSFHPATIDPNRSGHAHPTGVGGRSRCAPMSHRVATRYSGRRSFDRRRSVREYPPERPGMQPPEDAIDDRAMCTPGRANFARICGEFGRKQGILGIGQIVASHGNRLDYGKFTSVYHIRDRITRDSLLPHSLCVKGQNCEICSASYAHESPHLSSRTPLFVPWRLALARAPRGPSVACAGATTVDRLSLALPTG